MTDTPRREPQPLRVDVRRLVIQAVTLPLVLMAIVAGAFAWQVGRLSETSAAVARAARVIAQANEAQKLILDQETGLRAFLLTDDRRFLQPYEEARPEKALADLALLVAGDLRQATAVTMLQQQYQGWRRWADRAIAHPGEGRDSATLLVRKEAMDGIRASMAGLLDHEEAVRAARGRAAAVETRITTVGSVLVLAALGATLSILTRRAIRRITGAYDDALAKSAASEATQARLAADERSARAEAQEALRAKDEFLSTLSHELRTPLTAILGWSGVLRVQKVPEALDRALAAIERNARAQAQIVDDILDVSRIVAGKFQLRLTPTDVGDVVRAALDVVRFSAERKGVTLEARLEEEPIRMIADPDRLQQVVWNLLSNAIKFTPKHGHVEVRAGRRGSRVAIEVRDDGEGIPPDFLPHVFERFRQADQSPKRAHGGLGLGLSIVKHLVDLHGGEVRAGSEGRGRGATFSLSLPVGAAGPVPVPAPGDRAMVSLRGVRVLIVDDDPDSLAVLSAILRGRGADVDSAASGAEALAILGRAPVDVVVSDIGMPELDGYELLEKIRARAAAPPALALTAYAAAADVERARLAGFKEHLAKPVSAERLVEAVAGLART